MRTLLNVLLGIFAVYGLSFANYYTRNITNNVLWILVHFWRLPAGLKALRGVRRAAWDEASLRSFLTSTMIRRSGTELFRPWPFVVAMNGWRGECGAYAVMACEIARVAGVASAFYALLTSGTGVRHATALVTFESATLLASNEYLTLFRGWPVEFPDADVRRRARLP